MKSIMIKNNLPNILRDKKYSQKKLAEISGISQNTITKIYNQEISPNSDTMEKICVALELELGAIFFVEKKHLFLLQ